MSQEYNKIIEKTLKQSPNQIFWGEIRDPKEFKLFIQASISAKTSSRNVSRTETSSN